jgi:lysine 2,3-aminomutase
MVVVTSVCPVYCAYCTRARAVGPSTEANAKDNTLKPGRARWEEAFAYIEAHPEVQDVVISGGDAFMLDPRHLMELGERLLSIPHIKRFRIASKGLNVAPIRFLDQKDTWTDALIALCQKGRKMGKAVALHTHFNHPAEITWITKMAAQRLFEAGVMVRNQAVLLRGVNDNIETMGKLIRNLADNNIIPVSTAKIFLIYLCRPLTWGTQVLRVYLRHGEECRALPHIAPDHVGH